MKSRIKDETKTVVIFISSIIIHGSLYYVVLIITGQVGHATCSTYEDGFMPD